MESTFKENLRDNLEYLDDTIVQLSGNYTALSNLHTQMEECHTSLTVHSSNLEKPIFLMNNHSINLFAIASESVSYWTKQSEFDLSYSNAFIMRIEKAIDIAKMKIDLVRAKESSIVEKAALLLEIFLVSVYSLDAWKSINPEGFDFSPSWYRFLLAASLGLSVGLATYNWAEAKMQKREWKLRRNYLILSITYIIIIFFLMFGLR